MVLARASRESLNVRGAFLHVLTDVAAFGAAAVAGGLILATGWDRFDPIASLLVAVLMLWSSAQLLRESTIIFLERAPGDADPEAIGRALVSDRDVVEVHDLHVWTVTSGFPALSAHVLVTPGSDCHAARRRLELILSERFGLTHTTLQVEHAEPASTTGRAGRSRCAPRSARPLGSRGAQPGGKVGRRHRRVQRYRRGHRARPDQGGSARRRRRAPQRPDPSRP